MSANSDVGGPCPIPVPGDVSYGECVTGCVVGCLAVAFLFGLAMLAQVIFGD